MATRPKTVFRADSANARYTVISNALLQDPRLSHETKGLLCELLSRPADWEITVRGIVASGKSGRDKVYRMLDEAKALGYIKPDRERGADGTLGASYYTVRDHVEASAEPAPAPAKAPLPEKPEVVAQPLPGKPLPGNPPQQSKESNKIQNLLLSACARDLIEDEEGLRGRGFALSWPQVDLTAQLCAVPVDRARLIARTMALEWCQGAPPKSALATLRRALREEAQASASARPRQAPKAGPAPAKPPAGQPLCDHGYQASSCSACRHKVRPAPAIPAQALQ